jgi:HlyD family secretion protein
MCARIIVIALAAIACRSPDITEGRYQGMVELEQVDLGFEVTGRLAELRAQPGQQVRAGDVVAREDDSVDRELRALRLREIDSARADLVLVEAGTRVEDVRAARAQLAAARVTEASRARDLERERALVAAGALPRARLDVLEPQLAQARGEREALEQRARALTKGSREEEIARIAARVAQAEEALAVEERRLEKRALVSPVTGTVLDTYVDVGEIAAAGATVMSIVDRQRPYADVFVPVDEAPAIRIGAPVAVAAEGVDGEANGTVERMFPRAEFTPRFVYSPRERPNLVMRVRIRIADPAERLHAGLPVYVRLAARPLAAEVR